MKARILLGLSVLAGAGVMIYVMMQAGTDLAGMAGLLPVRLHLLALAAFVADFLGRAARIALLSRGVGHRVRFSTALWASFAGEGAGAVTPSKAGAAPAKIAILTRDGMDVGTGGAVMVGETLAEAAALLPLGLLALIFLPGGRTGAYAALGFAVLVGVGVVVLYWVARLPLRDAPAWWLKLGLSERRWRVLRVVARRFRHRSVALEHLSPGILAAIGVVTVVHIAGRLAVLPALAAGRVHGAAAVAALVGWPFVLLYGGAMVPTPAGGGAIEAAFAASLGGVIPAAAMGGLLVWWRFYTFYLPALLGGAVLVLGGVLFSRRKDPNPSTKEPAGGS